VVGLRSSISLKRLNMRGVMTDLSLSRRDFTIAAMNFPNLLELFSISLWPSGLSVYYSMCVASSELYFESVRSRQNSTVWRF
jgi:hypothetical protein